MFTTVPKNAQEFYTQLTEYFAKFPKTETEVKEAFKKVQSVFQAEYKNSQEMWKIYQKSLAGDATPNEVTKANKIAQELMKTAGFASLLAIPGSLFVLPALIKAAAEYKIDIVPATVAKEFNI